MLGDGARRTNTPLIAIGLGSENLGDPIFPLTDLWLKAVLAAVLRVLLLREVYTADSALRRRRRSAA